MNITAARPIFVYLRSLSWRPGGTPLKMDKSYGTKLSIDELFDVLGKAERKPRYR